MTKRPMGRPSKYREEFCDLLIEHMAKGLSFESFAGTQRVSRAVLYNWEEMHPEFLDAKKIGLEMNRLWWEKQGIDGLWTHENGPKFNTGLWIFNMVNRHGWLNKSQVDLKPLPLDVEREKIRKLPMNDLIDLVKTSLPEEKNNESHAQVPSQSTEAQPTKHTERSDR